MTDNHTRSDLIGVGLGLACFPAVLFAAEKSAGLQSAAVLFSIVLVGAATLAGIISAVLARASSPAELTPPLSARIGARTGALTVLVGSGAIVAALTFHALGVLTANAEQVPPYYGLIASALSALPAIFGASAVAMLVAPRQRFSKPSPPAGVTPDAENTDARPRNRGILPYILLFSSLCYLLPLLTFISFKKEAPPQPVVSDPVVPSPPPFAYEKPAGFDGASPSLWQVVAQKNIDNVLSDRPVVISPQEEFLFYCSRADRGTNLVIIRLDDVSTQARLTTFTTPRLAAWSPDSKRILLIHDSEKNALSVWDLEQQREIHLPIPTSKWLPEGYPIWWDEHEVAFRSDRGHTWVSLQTLRVRAIDSSPKWESLDEEERNLALALPQTNSLPQNPLPSNEIFQLSPVRSVASYSRIKGSDSALQTKHANFLGAFDLKVPFLRTFPAIDFNERDHLLATSDGTKVVRLRENSARIFYFGLKEEFSKVFALKIPEPIGGHPLLDSTSDEGSLEGIAAFICPPIVNPLNGEVVAANRATVKGVVKFLPGEGDDMKAWLAQETFPIDEGDVLADPYRHDGRNFRPSETPLGLYGWAHLSRLPIENNALIPAAPEEPPAKEPSSTELSSKPSPSPNQPGPLVTEEQIVAFVKAHHEKASNRDVDGLVSDYAERVDFFDQGIVDHDYIRRDQTKFYESYLSILETVSDEIEIEEMEPHRSRVAYQLVMALTKQNGNKELKRVQASLDLDLSRSPPKIMRQRGEVIATGPSAGSRPAETSQLASPQARIAAFLKNHHSKLGRGDQKGWVSDYTDPFKSKDKSYSHNQVLRAMSASTAQISSVSEDITGDIQVSRLSENTFRAVYEISNTIFDRRGRKAVTRASRTVDILMTTNGPKIYAEREVTR
jgi:hypothetical protein